MKAGGKWTTPWALKSTWLWGCQQILCMMKNKQKCLYLFFIKLYWTFFNHAKWNGYMIDNVYQNNANTFSLIFDGKTQLLFSKMWLWHFSEKFPSAWVSLMSNLNRTLSLDPRLFQEIRRKGAVPISGKPTGWSWHILQKMSRKLSTK